MQAPLSFHCFDELNKELCFLFLIDELLSFYPKVCKTLNVLEKKPDELGFIKELFPRKKNASYQMSPLEKITFLFPLFFPKKKESFSFSLLERKLEHLLNSFSETDPYFRDKEVLLLSKQLLCHLEKELYILFHSSLPLFSSFQENENVVFFFHQKKEVLKLLPFSLVIEKLEKELDGKKTEIIEKFQNRGFSTLPRCL